MDTTSFSVFTEFSVGIAGFSGIALAIRRGGDVLTGIQRFRTITLMAWALAPAFASTFPLVFEGFGVTGTDVWRYSSLLFGFVASLVVFVPFMLSRSMTASERAGLSTVIWYLGVGGNVAIAALLFGNGMGPASPGPILLGLIWHLLMAALLFARLLLGWGATPHSSSDTRACQAGA